MKKSEIKVNVELDNLNLPEKISWIATDSGVDEERQCKALMMSVWDPSENTTLKIDLWTKDMMIEDMKIFFHQTLVSMAATFERATNEDKISGDMKDFCDYFAEKMGLKNEEK
jgi:gliding motility-associated protein GldC